jgi:SRSO17 transposase
VIVDQLNGYEAAAPMMIGAVELARTNRDELLGHRARVFARREPRLQAGRYVDGLLADLPRKNGWTLAEHAADATPDRMQRLLYRASSDETAAMGVVRDYVAEHLHDAFAVAVLDESGSRRRASTPPG